MPFHLGHLELIQHAAGRCQRLLVLVCTQRWEPLDGELRLEWVRDCVASLPSVEVRHFTTELPYAGLASAEVSRIWGRHLRKELPEIDVIFTCEEYGDRLAEIMGVEHASIARDQRDSQVRASEIRSDPVRYWDRLPEAVRPHFVRRICLFGPESVGKSTLAERLARHFGTTFVPELGREMIPDSRTCRFEDLEAVAVEHAREILRRLPRANRLLFLDTDLLTTKAYARFLFERTLEVARWIEEANRIDLYLFCESDVPYVQDGTRLGGESRPAQRTVFLSMLRRSGRRFEVIRGNYEERLLRAIDIVEQTFMRGTHAPSGASRDRS